MVNIRSLVSRACSRRTPARRLAVGLRGIAFAAALLLLFSGPAQAGEKTPEEIRSKYAGGAETFLYSRYVSRGIASSDGPVLQPSAWITLDDVTLSVFGNYVLTNEKQQGRFNEADASLAWAREWNGFTIEPKFTLYTYPNTDDQSQYEAGLTLARDLGPWRLSTFHSVTFAVSEKAFYYGELVLGYRRDLPKKLSFEAEFAVTWPTPAAVIEGKLSYDLTDHWSLSLHAGCSITRSDAALSDNHASGNEDTLPQGRNGFIGLGLGFRF